MWSEWRLAPTFGTNFEMLRCATQTEPRAQITYIHWKLLLRQAQLCRDLGLWLIVAESLIRCLDELTACIPLRRLRLASHRAQVFI